VGGVGSHDVEAECVTSSDVGRSTTKLEISEASLEPVAVEGCTEPPKSDGVWVNLADRSCAIDGHQRMPLKLVGLPGGGLELPDGKRATFDATGHAEVTLDLVAIADKLPVSTLQDHTVRELDALAVRLPVVATVQGHATTVKVAVKLGPYLLDLLKRRHEHGIAPSSHESNRCAVVLPSMEKVTFVGPCETLGDIGFVAVGNGLTPMTTTVVCRSADGASSPVKRAGERVALTRVTGTAPLEHDFLAPPPSAPGTCKLFLLGDAALGPTVLQVPLEDIVRWVTAQMNKGAPAGTASAATSAGATGTGGTVAASGGLPKEVVQRIVRQNFGRFRLCYENGLRKNPSLAGSVVTKVAVGADGRVTQAQDAASTLPDRAVVDCVVRGFSNLSFPAPTGGPTSFTYPVAFKPGE
jgi:hypothetical protein